MEFCVAMDHKLINTVCVTRLFMFSVRNMRTLRTYEFCKYTLFIETSSCTGINLSVDKSKVVSVLFLTEHHAMRRIGRVEL